MPRDDGHFTQEHGAGDYETQAWWGKGWSHTKSAVSAVIKFTLQFPVAPVLQFWWVLGWLQQLVSWNVSKSEPMQVFNIAHHIPAFVENISVKSVNWIVQAPFHESMYNKECSSYLENF